MKTKQVTPQQLDGRERMIIALDCKHSPEFVIVRHDRDTVYFNGNHPAAAQLESLFLDMLTADYLDQPTATGAIPFDILDTVTRTTNADAANMFFDIWKYEVDRRKDAERKAKAIAWRKENPCPEELPGMDTDLLYAIYFTVKEIEGKAPAQKHNNEHAFSKALQALFYYGYQYGMAARS